MLTRTFIDTYGNDMTDTPIMTHRAGKVTTDETVVRFPLYADENNPQQVQIYYQMQYWISQAAKDAGADPLIFKYKDLEGDYIDNWRFSVTTDYDGLTIEQAVEKHFRNFVFPDGQPAGQYNPVTLV